MVLHVVVGFDFQIAIVIIAGLLVLFPPVFGDVGRLQGLAQQAPAEHFRFAPEQSFYGCIMFTQGLVVPDLGNIASQDLVRRVLSSRDERVAHWSMYRES